MGTNVTLSETANRFEACVDGEVAFLEFRRSDSSLTLTHTEVPKSLGGKGIGSSLVEAALDYARKESLKVVPLCPFAETYMRRHKETLDLLR
jgi:predicted GNAT family acetyltransferase